MHSYIPLSPTTLLERSGRAFPNRSAIAYPDGIVTYAELLHRSRCLAQVLKGLQVGYGDDAPFSQPRNILGGHFFSSLIGLVCLTLFGATWWSVAIAVGTAISVMMLTRTTHPPAGSNPVIIYLTKPVWSFLLFPTVFGAIVLIFVALLYNNFTRESRYPKYW